MSYEVSDGYRVDYAHGSAIPASARRFTNHPARRVFMNAIRITGIVLIVLGLAGFFTGGFSFTKDTTKANIGPIQLSVQEKESVNIPQWLSIGAIVLGAVVLVLGSRKS
jgi:drug/metabolite transporter (DMT)-like permease